MSIAEGFEISKLGRPPHKDSYRTTYQGVLDMTAGRVLAVARSSPIVSDLSLTVPAGKVWRVLVRIDIIESAA
jgi:hypothetical protein